MTDYKATPEQWSEVEGESWNSPRCSCLMELRARVEALEANAKPTPNLNQIRSSLVERVGNVLGNQFDDWDEEARAAIREVARWMDENQSPVTAQWLEEEAER